MICRATVFASRRALRGSLSVLALGLTVSTWAQTPPVSTGRNPVPPSGGSPSAPTSPGSAGQKPVSGDSAAPPATGAPTSSTPTSSVVMQLKKEIQGGDFSYRFVSANGETALTAVTPLPIATGTNVMVGVPSNVNLRTSQMEVLDNTHGNLARFPLTVDIRVGAKPLTEGSFTYAQRINILVQKGGLGLIGAQVTLTDAAKSYNKTTTLQASDGGLARFDNVPLGKELTATVSYAEHKISVTQTLPASRTGDGWSPMTVDWADAKTVPAPAVLAPPPAPMKGESADSGSHRDHVDAQSNAGPFSGVLSTLVSLLFLGGLFYGLYWLYQNGKLKNVFDKLGLSNAVMATEAGTPAPSPFDKPAKPAIQPITDGTTDPFGGVGMAGGGMGAAPMPIATGPRLVATMGTYAGAIFPLLGPSTDIGRDAGNPIPLPNDTNTSRRHATLQLTNGQVVLVDNASSNGTYVNGVRIASQVPQPLRTGDEVNIGNTRFRFEA
jgi:hypothetical protein